MTWEGVAAVLFGLMALGWIVEFIRKLYKKWKKPEYSPSILQSELRGDHLNLHGNYHGPNKFITGWWAYCATHGCEYWFDPIRKIGCYACDREKAKK